MAYISFQPSDNFNTKLYTGDNTASQPQTGVGFQPDFVWIKAYESGSDWQAWNNSVSGTTKALYSNNSDAEATSADYLTAYGADGFTVGNNGSFGGSKNYAAWCLRAGTTTGLSGGTISPTGYSFNATAGFSIIRYTGTGATATVPHGLGAKPTCIIVKQENGTNNWAVYSESLGNNKQFLFNDTSTPSTNSNIWATTDPTSTVFSVGNDGATGGSGSEYVAYCFANTKGCIKNGTYTGNGQSDRSGTFCYTGFAPAMVLLSRTSAGGNKNLYDNKRNPYNLRNDRLCANLTNAQAEDDTQAMEFHATGFKLRSTNSDQNDAGSTYWYLAFAEFPVVSSNSKSGTAR